MNEVGRHAPKRTVSAVKVAAAQWAVSDRSWEHNLAVLTSLAQSAADQGAGLIVAPEAAMLDFGAQDNELAAQPLDGPWVEGLTALAASTGLTVIAGMFELVPGEGRCFNTVTAVDGGGIRGAYRKIHLFDALGWRESDRLLPGDGGTLVLAVDELTVGVMTCYDVRFPELARVLVDAGATALAVPAAWVAGHLKRTQWLTLLRARAIESTAYVIGAAQSPPRYAGASTVIDPFGEVLVELGDEDGSVAVAEAAAECVVEVRAKVPSLANRRYSVVPGSP
ncbi:MAG: deaminated glutathione amidase [Frankiaceae bacterium]|nr:deaminated glutathione amidase [Frankiaceae bacterium]